MIGDSCGYLHKMDRNRMPICRYACVSCSIPALITARVCADDKQ